jgi:hypothetical protein
MPLRMLQVSENTTIGLTIGSVLVADFVVLWLLIAK